MSDSTVQMGVWVAFGAETEIEYRIFPGADMVEFTLGGPHGLDLEMNEAGLRRCISAFAGALNELTNAAASPPERVSDQPSAPSDSCDEAISPDENKSLTRTSKVSTVRN